ncbi:hypothetical protein [Borrelia parkeri]|uniref:hypothetical protein n=1 Tax=Borrelia parkeri TaxID=141 RepID=UPI0003D95AEA|nr:hypothetical protein [Borrelia parkeri]AHE63169.1 hypothetical protein X966_03565 [Borrelia parkeri HR1]
MNVRQIGNRGEGFALKYLLEKLNNFYFIEIKSLNVKVLEYKIINHQMYSIRIYHI